MAPRRYPTAAKIVEKMDNERRLLEATFAHLDESQMAAPSTPQVWSVKDHLIHLAMYAVGVNALLDYQPRWASMQLDEAFVFDKRNTLDDINALLYDQHKEDALADVLAAFDDAHRRFRAAILRMSDEDLAKPYVHYQPLESNANPVSIVVHTIIGDSYEHYAEHRPWIEEYIVAKGWNRK